ncbi:MAG: exosortase C-terminal domain/associated protein EpsI, partial [Longimicrobiales bacterium]
YWYQGRGRIEASEYMVKLNLLRDSMFRQRSDEALVRIVVPVTTTEEDALDLATRVAADMAPAVDAVLPE